MSLLIDALRKAEQAKRDAQQAAAADGALELTPPDTATSGAAGHLPPPPSSGPSGESRLAFETGAASRGAAYLDAPAESTRGAEADAAARKSARLLFDAKTPPAPRRTLQVVVALGLLAGIAIAAYVWWALQPRGGVGRPPPLTRAAPRPAEPVPPPAPAQPRIEAPAAPATSSAPRATDSAAATDNAAAPSLAAAERPPRPRSAGSVRPAIKSARGDTGESATAPPPPARPLASSAPATPADASSGIAAIRHDSPAPALPPKLDAAYASYVEGRLAEAETLYRQALDEFPQNRDAINGLGAVALREGRRDDAAQWFRRALALDPNDPVAAAGLANLDAPRAPLDTESRLKQLLARNPDAAPAHFALGNALALQQRWSEAQQSYFRAYTLDAANPDYLYNLAVSLDHLNQGALARRFYLEALSAAAARPAAFDPAALRARLDTLP